MGFKNHLLVGSGIINEIPFVRPLNNSKLPSRV